MGVLTLCLCYLGCVWRAHVLFVVDVADGTVAQRMDDDEFDVVTADSNPGLAVWVCGRVVRRGRQARAVWGARLRRCDGQVDGEGRDPV